MLNTKNGHYAFGATDSWWEDETPAEQSWWLKAVRVAYGDALVKTLTDAYAVGTTAAKAQVEQIKQATAEELRRRAEAAGTQEAKRLAAAAEARVRKAAEQKAYEGGFKGMLAVGGVGLVLYLVLRPR